MASLKRLEGIYPRPDRGRTHVGLFAAILCLNRLQSLQATEQILSNRDPWSLFIRVESPANERLLLQNFQNSSFHSGRATVTWSVYFAVEILQRSVP